MPLKLVEAQDWSGDFAYAPPTRKAVINTEHIVSAVEVESRGAGPWCKVLMTDGSSLIVRARPEDLLLQEPGDER